MVLDRLGLQSSEILQLSLQELTRGDWLFMLLAFVFLCPWYPHLSTLQKNTCVCFPFVGPPSAPRNVISNINETSVILDWSWPLDTGGRKDVTFNIICKKCGGSSKLCEPCSDNVRFLPSQTGLTNTTVTVVDLLAHTNYTFEIDAVNGVSGLSTLSRQFAAVSITTNQAGESPSDYRFFVQNYWDVCTFVSIPCFTGVTLNAHVLG